MVYTDGDERNRVNGAYIMASYLVSFAFVVLSHIFVGQLSRIFHKKFWSSAQNFYMLSACLVIGLARNDITDLQSTLFCLSFWQTAGIAANHYGHVLVNLCSSCQQFRNFSQFHLSHFIRYFVRGCPYCPIPSLFIPAQPILSLHCEVISVSERDLLFTFRLSITE